MQTRRAQRLIRRSRAAAWLLLTSPMLIAQGTTPSTLAPASTPVKSTAAPKLNSRGP